MPSSCASGVATRYARECMVATPPDSARARNRAPRMDDATACALAASPSLVELDALQSEHLSVVGVRALAACTSLQTLDISWCFRLRADAARVLADSPSITDLRIAGDIVGAEGIVALAANTRLCRLDVNCNWIQDYGAAALCRSPSITTLNVCGCGITSWGARALARMPTLTWLNAASNMIRDDGAAALSVAPRLTFLDARHNAITSTGAVALAGSASLTHLNLGCNYVGESSAAALRDAPALTHLNLSNTIMDECGLARLLRSTTLTCLTFGPDTLSGVPFSMSDAAARRLAWVFTPPATLRRRYMGICRELLRGRALVHARRARSGTWYARVPLWVIASTLRALIH